MDKTSQKVTKDPKRQEQGRKSYETYMKRLKKQILEDNQLPTPSLMGNSTPSTPSSTPSTSSPTCDSMPFTPSHAAGSNDTYVYGIIYLLYLPLAFVYFCIQNFP